MEKLAVIKAVTSPGFLIVASSGVDCASAGGAAAAATDEVSRILREMAHFAPSQTVLFREILGRRCSSYSSSGPPLVVDVGAHIGYFSLYAAAMGCRVLAFEPVPGPGRYLMLSAALNQYYNFTV